MQIGQEIAPLDIPGAWLVSPRLHPDGRGVFLESFAAREFEEATGRTLDLRQANVSSSAAGVVRGVHFADVPPGQAKYVTVASGAAYDVVVDLRVGSPTFGRWQGVVLDDADRRAVFVSEGLGHAFLALRPDTVVTYLCSAPYAPDREHGISPFDPALGIAWPDRDPDGGPLTLTASDKDRAAPTLAQAQAAGMLPRADDVAAFIATREVDR